MQQTRSYWRLVAVAGVLGTMIATACTVTTNSDDGVAGSGAIAGNTSVSGSGGSTAGSAGSTGIAGTGGTGNTTIPFQCDPANGTAAKCPAADPNNQCTTCITTSCCAEYGACYSTGPGNQCGWGGPNGDGEGEFTCIQRCVIAATADGGVADGETLGTCTNNCVTPKDTQGASCGATIGTQTNDLVGCVNTNCQAECFGG